MTVEQQRVLQAIKRWKLSNDDPRGEKLLQQIVDAWQWRDLARQVVPGRWVFATGGYSVHEEIFVALQKNWQWMALCGLHRLHVPGGLLIVATSDDQRRQLGHVKDCLVRWAWGEGKPEIAKENK